MCGIVGVVNLDGAPVDVGVVERMLEVQAHRGPDDRGLRGFSLAGAVSRELTPAAPSRFDGALGFNRLSILDLSAEGHQPMANPDGSVFVAFNGEIYNAFDYRRDLEAAGFRFHSRTDTEVILYLYEHFGLEGMLARLSGMYAIAIVDLRRGEVHVARDPFGVKPLHWTQAGAALLFASEAKAFLRHPAFRVRLDESCIDEYLAFRYCADDRSLLQGVRQLRPGHRLRITARGVEVFRHWDVPEPDPAPIGLEAATQRLDELLRGSVKAQLLSDRKVGCQLSGGIDSSLVCLAASPHLGGRPQTFSVVFDDPALSEEPWIRAAEAAAGADGHRYTFTPEDFFDTLEPATWHMDHPLSHPNALGILRLARGAAGHVTVLLSGEGADEVFGGYPRHYHAAIRGRLLPWLPLLARLPRWGERFARNLGQDHADPGRAFIAASMFTQPAALAALRPGFGLARVLDQRHATFREGRGGHLDNCLRYDLATYMAELLVRQDKMTMAHSLENRVPFLDPALYAYVRALPAALKVDASLASPRHVARHTKVVLKALARRTFGDGFVYRSKSGFGLPLAAYCAHPRFTALMEERLLPGMQARGLVRADVVRAGWQSIVQGRGGNPESLWTPVALELWAQRFLDPGGAR